MMQLYREAFSEHAEAMLTGALGTTSQPPTLSPPLKRSRTEKSIGSATSEVASPSQAASDEPVVRKLSFESDDLVSDEKFPEKLCNSSSLREEKNLVAGLLMSMLLVAGTREFWKPL